MADFKKDLRQQYKEWIFWAKIIIFVVVCVIGWLFYSLYNQNKQQTIIENQKKQEIEKIQKSFNDENKKDSEIDKMLNDKTVNIIETKADENKKEDELKQNLLIGETRESQKVKTDELKEKQIEEENKKKNALVGSFCIVGSWDSDKQLFFSTFNYQNQHLIRNILKKIDPTVINYQAFCFMDTKLSTTYITKVVKTYKEAKTYEEKLKLARKHFDFIRKKSWGFSHITFSKKNWMSELSSYNWCWNDDLSNKIMERLRIVPMKINEIEKKLKDWSVYWEINCKIQNINNIVFVEKNVPFTKYYNELFKTKDNFNTAKTNKTYNTIFWNLNYNDGIEAFIKILNQEPMKWWYSSFSKWTDLDKDYIDQEKKSLLKQYIVMLSQIMNERAFQ